MEDTIRGGPPEGRELSHDELETFVVEMVRAHADGLLRLARRHSVCADDAHDAYQRGFEIFLRHAGRLDRDRAPSWLRTVVKHEAMAVRRGRLREVGSADIDFDLIEARNATSPDEAAASFEQVARSAEALQRLKPQEVRALWLRAEGHSYEEIQDLTGWSRTKVNRCLYEGRRAFLARYAGIAAGEECGRWEPLLSALVDGEATTDQLLALRPHLRHCTPCRSALRELHRSATPLAAVFPAGAVVMTAEHLDHGGHVFLRVYESVTHWLGERAASSAVRTQLLVEAVAGSAHKATAVAATAATVAGGGAVAIEKVARPAVPPARTVALGRADAANPPAKLHTATASAARRTTTVARHERSPATRHTASGHRSTTTRKATSHAATTDQQRPVQQQAVQQPQVQQTQVVSSPAPAAAAAQPSAAAAEMGLE